MSWMSRRPSELFEEIRERQQRCCAGDSAGYYWHQSRGVPPCPESRQAYLAYMRDYSAKRRAAAKDGEQR